jgi:N-acetylglutamate synthase-like GNAT family acetyltransferase
VIRNSTLPDPESLRIELRPAEQKDFAAIRELIRAVHINPLGLDWRRFILAADASGHLVACGQIKPHQDGSLELASIAVIPEMRGRGIATKIIERLIGSNPGPLFLTCRASLEKFYMRFGFSRLEMEEMPPYFRRMARMARIARALKLVPVDLLVMKREY